MLASGRANLKDAMLAVYDTVIPQFHNFLQSNVVNQVSMLAIIRLLLSRIQFCEFILQNFVLYIHISLVSLIVKL